MNKIFKAIGNSTLEKTTGNRNRIYSSSIISSYFILVTIWLSAFVFISIDISNTLLLRSMGQIYEIPMSHIFIYSLTLTHHLVLLGLKRGSDAKYLESTVKMKEIDANAQIQAQAQHGYDDYSYGNMQPPCMQPPCMRNNYGRPIPSYNQPSYRDDDRDRNRDRDRDRDRDRNRDCSNDDDIIDDNMSRAPRSV